MLQWQVRAFKKAPKINSEAIEKYLKLGGTVFEKIEIAGPGFMNFFLSQKFYSDVS